MNFRMTPKVTHNDAELVGASLSGNRDAFGQIVSRYQSLVCSLAFSATDRGASAHEIALGGLALAHHANDAVAREFLARHRWLDFDRDLSRNLFFLICISPMMVSMVIWGWRRPVLAKHVRKN